MKTQKMIILEHLEKHKTITTLESQSKLGILDPQHYIMQLRKEGYNIQDRWVKSTNRYGKKVHYKEYKLIQENYRRMFLEALNERLKQKIERC